ncbi:ABC transporter ATP-binding protein [Fulvivirgaceae bacterium LMO-SS25]
MYSVETKNINHHFSKNSPTLTNINLKVPQGSIFGFLGKNGAGKTTTLKLILGLLERQEGEIRLFDKDFKTDRIEILKRTGSLIESPSFYGHLSATENLRILQKIYQCPKERIQEVLTLVGLADSGVKNVNQFSLGMKQRLSIAISMLHQPELLILDEPTNGLDPNGIIEIRELLLKINSELGTTIIISSHLLSEIERIVSHIAIINKGELLFQGKMEELKAKALSTISLETDNPNLASKIIQKYNVNTTQEGNMNLLTNYSREAIPDIIKDLVSNDIAIYKVNEQEMSLESIFINLTEN